MVTMDERKSEIARDRKREREGERERENLGKSEGQGRGRKMTVGTCRLPKENEEREAGRVSR